MNKDMFRRVKRLFAREEGVTLVEMAICTGVLMSVLLGIFQVSLVIYSFQMVADAAREGSRFAMVRGSVCPVAFTVAYCSPSAANAGGAINADVLNYVRSLNYPGHNQMSTTMGWFTGSGTQPSTWSACDPTAATCNGPGNQVQVTVTYNYPLNIPFVPKFTIPLTSTSTEVIVQ